MSETVAEFTQKSYKKYACGRAAQKAKKVLMKGFTASEEKDAVREGTLFEAIVDSVMKTKKGRERNQSRFDGLCEIRRGGEA